MELTENAICMFKYVQPSRKVINETKLVERGTELFGVVGFYALFDTRTYRFLR